MFWNYDLDKIVQHDHCLRKINNIISFEQIAEDFKNMLSVLGRKGYSLEAGIKGLFLQFYYDLPDREIEERLRYDMAFRWFCNFSIDEKTPDHSYFGRIRKLLTIERIAKIFKKIKENCEEKGLIRQVFTFVDSTVIKSKENTWTERDKALKEQEEKLNNDNIDKYSSDKDARFGCKGKDKFWYGYKRHVSVDMSGGIINKVAVTPANVTDQKGLEYICPEGGMVFADKQYCTKNAQEILKSKGCHSGAILKKNMKEKNKEKDKWLTGVRMPFEGTFSRFKKRARYRGIKKVELQVFLEAIVFNVKRLVVLSSSPPIKIIGA